MSAAGASLSPGAVVPLRFRRADPHWHPHTWWADDRVLGGRWGLTRAVLSGGHYAGAWSGFVDGHPVSVHVSQCWLRCDAVTMIEQERQRAGVRVLARARAVIAARI